MTTYKRPSEKVPFGVDFARVMPDGQTLQNASDVKVYDSDEADVTSSLLDAVSISGTKVNASIKNGSDMADYTIVFIAITEAYRFEEKVILRVRNG